jgi:hypothetical protein
MNHGLETSVGFVAAHGDALELFDFAEEILHQMPPFVHLQVNIERFRAPRMLRDDNVCPSLPHFRDNPIRIKGLVGNEAAELEIFDEPFDADRVVTLSRQENKPNQVAERIGKRQNFGRQASFRLAYSLTLSPPFAPCPWR